MKEIDGEMIWISLFSLWSNWDSFSVHCQPTHFPPVCMCICSCVYLYLFSLLCEKLTAVQSHFIGLYSLTYFRPRAPTVLSSWLIMRMTTHTMWVLQAHANADGIYFQLLTLSVFLSLLSPSLWIITCHTHIHTFVPLSMGTSQWHNAFPSP